MGAVFVRRGEFPLRHKLRCDMITAMLLIVSYRSKYRTSIYRIEIICVLYRIESSSVGCCLKVLVLGYRLP